MKCGKCSGRVTGAKKSSTSSILRGERRVVEADCLADLVCPRCGSSGSANKTSCNKTTDNCWRVRCQGCSTRYNWRSTNAKAEIDADADLMIAPEDPLPHAMPYAFVRSLDPDEASLIREWLSDARAQLGSKASSSNSFEVYDLGAARRLSRIGLVTMPKAGRFGASVDLVSARRLLAEYDNSRGRM